MSTFAAQIAERVPFLVSLFIVLAVIGSYVALLKEISNRAVQRVTNKWLRVLTPYIVQESVEGKYIPAVALREIEESGDVIRWIESGLSDSYRLGDAAETGLSGNDLSWIVWCSYEMIYTHLNDSGKPNKWFVRLKPLLYLIVGGGTFLLLDIAEKSPTYEASMILWISILIAVIVWLFSTKDANTHWVWILSNVGSDKWRDVAPLALSANQTR